MTDNDPHHGQRVLAAGAPIEKAAAAAILLHGRGASAEDILSLAHHFYRDDVAYIAPDAAGHTWYPFPFTAPVEQNEPFLGSALRLVHAIVHSLGEQGLPADRIMFLGFSQGACLALEYTARQARRYGGVVGLSGGLIGADVMQNNYSGELAGTPVLLGCSDVDPHIPVKRVRDTSAIFRAMGADVDMRLYPDLGHSVNEDEIARVKEMLDIVATAASSKSFPVNGGGTG
jgi:predicted esterase